MTDEKSGTDKAHVVELAALLMLEKIITQEINTGIESGKPYKDIYRAIKNRLSVFSDRR